MRYFCFGLVCLSLVGLSGCGGGPDNNAVIKMEYNPATAIKEGLEGVKSSGRLGSGFGSVMSAVRELKKVDQAKGDEIEKELTALMEIKDAAKVKTKAAEIIAKL
jgi:hypothetical protein